MEKARSRILTFVVRPPFSPPKHSKHFVLRAADSCFYSHLGREGIARVPPPARGQSASSISLVAGNLVEGEARVLSR